MPSLIYFLTVRLFLFLQCETRKLNKTAGVFRTDSSYNSFQKPSSFYVPCAGRETNGFHCYIIPTAVNEEGKACQFSFSIHQINRSNKPKTSVVAYFIFLFAFYSAIPMYLLSTVRELQVQPPTVVDLLSAKSFQT